MTKHVYIVNQVLRYALVLFVFFLVSSYIFAQSEFSIDFDSKITLHTIQHDYPDENQIILKPSLDISIEARHGLGLETRNTISYTLDGWVSYSRYKEVEGNLRKFIISLAFPELDGAEFLLNVGRQPFADRTENILNESLDGVNAQISINDLLNAQLGIGFSGLFAGNRSNIILSPADESNKLNKDWASAANRLLILGDLIFNLIPTLTLGTHLGLQLDLRDPASSSFNYSSWYVGINSAGFIIEDILHYDAHFTLNIGHYSNSDIPEAGILLSNYWSFWFPTEGIGGIRLGIDVSSENFKAFSKIQQGSFFQGSVDALFALGWEIFWQPFSLLNLQSLRSFEVFFQGKHFVSTKTGQNKAGFLSSAADSGLFGHELEIGFEAPILSDFGVEASMGGLFGNPTNGKDIHFFSDILVYLKL